MEAEEEKSTDSSQHFNPRIPAEGEKITLQDQRKRWDELHDKKGVLSKLEELQLDEKKIPLEKDTSRKVSIEGVDSDLTLSHDTEARDVSSLDKPQMLPSYHVPGQSASVLFSPSSKETNANSHQSGRNAAQGNTPSNIELHPHTPSDSSLSPQSGNSLLSSGVPPSATRPSGGSPSSAVFHPLSSMEDEQSADSYLNSSFMNRTLSTVPLNERIEISDVITPAATTANGGTFPNNQVQQRLVSQDMQSASVNQPVAPFTALPGVISQHQDVLFNSMNHPTSHSHQHLGMHESSPSQFPLSHGGAPQQIPVNPSGGIHDQLPRQQSMPQSLPPSYSLTMNQSGPHLIPSNPLPTPNSAPSSQQMVEEKDDKDDFLILYHTNDKNYLDSFTSLCEKNGWTWSTKECFPYGELILNSLQEELDNHYIVLIIITDSLLNDKELEHQYHSALNTCIRSNRWNFVAVRYEDVQVPDFLKVLNPGDSWSKSFEKTLTKTLKRKKTGGGGMNRSSSCPGTMSANRQPAAQSPRLSPIRTAEEVFRQTDRSLAPGEFSHNFFSTERFRHLCEALDVMHNASFSDWRLLAEKIGLPITQINLLRQRGSGFTASVLEVYFKLHLSKDRLLVLQNLWKILLDMGHFQAAGIVLEEIQSFTS